MSALPNVFAADQADKHFKMMDADGDGKVTRAEHAAGAKGMFAQCDANRDGIVTAAEMDAALSKKDGEPARGELSSAEKIKLIDGNGDGKLTVAEHEAGTEKMFGKMDTDGDGTLSKMECAQGMKMKKKQS